MVATTPLTITAQTKILIGKIERRIKNDCKRKTVTDLQESADG